MQGEKNVCTFCVYLRIVCHADKYDCTHEYECMQVCLCVCAFVSGRRYTGCHCLCGRVIEEEVVEGETQDKESETLCVCVCQRQKESSVYGPRAVIISLSAVDGVGLQRGLSVSFCHNMSHRRGTHTQHTHTFPEDIMSKWELVCSDKLPPSTTNTHNLSPCSSGCPATVSHTGSIPNSSVSR